MVDTTFISSSPTLDYAFDKAGSYVLRLRIDNGESIGFHYYDLRVQAGFDEGFLILCNDDEGAGSLAFGQETLSRREEAEGAQEIWDNLLTINPEYDFRSLRDVYVFSSPGYASGIPDLLGRRRRLDLPPRPRDAERHLSHEGDGRTRESHRRFWAKNVGNRSLGLSDRRRREEAYRYEFSTDMLIVRETPFPHDTAGRDYSPRKPPECATSSCSPRPESPDSPIRESRDTPHPTGMNSSTWQRAASGRDSTTLSKYYCIARTIEGAPKTVKIISTSSSLSESDRKSRPTTRCGRC